MPRPIWNGVLSFGLVNVPVSLMPGERQVDLHFRMLDSRDNAPIRYERVNAETGEEVPWKDIVKAFEYDKGNYVVLKPEDIRSAASESHESIDIIRFVAAGDISPQYFEKPYVLVPGKKSEKGYVLLRETLAASDRVGIAKVVIRTREYLCAVMPHEHALILMILRYPQEIIDIDEYSLPKGKSAAYRVNAQELQMAKQLIESMSGDWRADEHKDEFRARLRKVIDQRVRSKGKVPKRDKLEAPAADDAATNVVDFMALLQQSLSTNKRTPAKKSAAPVKKAATRPRAKERTQKAAAAAPTRAKAAKKKVPARATRRAG